MPTIENVLSDPATSFWLKHALSAAIERDPVDAANDADLLSLLLAIRAEHTLKNPVLLASGGT